jgi:hypothetical protein
MGSGGMGDRFLPLEKKLMSRPPREPEPLGIGCYVTDLEQGPPASGPKPDDRADVQSEPEGSEIPDDTSDDADS